MPQDQKPFSETRAALLVAAVAGIPAGAVGVVASVSVLYLLSLIPVPKDKDGKQPNKFIPWLIIGMLTLGFTNYSPHSVTTKPDQVASKKANPPTINSSDLLEGFTLSANFIPGVEGRSSEETCNTTSENCQKWTFLAKRCEQNMSQREAGYTGELAPYCSEMESLREKATGIDLSTDTGAYDF
jgi:hypothetical protein